MKDTHTKIKVKQLTRPTIKISGARVNNLKNIDIELPKNTLIVVSGLSGSGKSSVAIDTLYAEGQRRYVESLSAYARQFLSRMKKPEVDSIKGICPAIAVEQKVSTSNARSTVGSLTEINDYLRLLFARVGKTYSPVSGQLVKKHEVKDVVDYIDSLPEGSKCMLLIPFPKKYLDRKLKDEVVLLLQKGYSRLWVNNTSILIEDYIEQLTQSPEVTLREIPVDSHFVVLDRFTAKQGDQDFRFRISDSVQTAFDESLGECTVWHEGDLNHFNNRFELDGIEFIEPSPDLFNYNNPYGACPQCEGYGKVIGISDDKVVPDKSLSVYDGAVLPWKGESGSWWQQQFIKMAAELEFPIHRSYEYLTEKELDLLWNGDGKTEGINKYFRSLEEKSYKIQNRVILARYRGKTTCPFCKGKRLRREALYVKVGPFDLPELTVTPIDELLFKLKQLELNEFEQNIASRVLYELLLRLQTMCTIGLNYLHLDRISSTLSGGEIQRLNLTRTLSSNLSSSLYILDEPSVGLHPRDTLKLIEVLKKLRDLGNTVLVVEHEEDIIRQADFLLDMGPGAGVHGGEVVFSGNFRNANPDEHLNSYTVQYLHRRQVIPTGKIKRKSPNKISLSGASEHNLKKVDCDFPLQAMTVVTGVSGSGKSTLVKNILVPALQQSLAGNDHAKTGTLENFAGDLKRVDAVEIIGQSPMGRSSRSNPVTYVKAFDHIRDLFTKQQLSKIRGYKPKHFSFNVEGGRCETCKGDGQVVVEMQFLADVALTCEDCQGKRFKKEILEVEFNNKNIFQVLDMSIEESIGFFQRYPEITSKLKALDDVGLGYLKLGQSSSTLSGGEAQRVKLASYLHKSDQNRMFFVFDEPSTGLHLHDVRKLLGAFQALIEQGHTVVIVEHHLDIIKNADWVIDLGPEAGINGGYLLYQGAPEGLIHVEASYTGKYLKQKWKEEGFLVTK